MYYCQVWMCSSVVSLWWPDDQQHTTIHVTLDKLRLACKCATQLNVTFTDLTVFTRWPGRWPLAWRDQQVQYFIKMASYKRQVCPVVPVLLSQGAKRSGVLERIIHLEKRWQKNTVHLQAPYFESLSWTVGRMKWRSCDMWATPLQSKRREEKFGLFAECKGTRGTVACPPTAETKEREKINRTN